MKNNLLQKRLYPSFQLIIATSPQGEPDFPEEDKSLLTTVIMETLEGVKKKDIKFESYGIGRGAGGGAWGIDLQEIFDSFKVIGGIKSAVDIAIKIFELTNKIRKNFSRKKTIVYSKSWLEHYSIGCILKNTDENELKTILSYSLTGGSMEEYEYIDYYLFLFSAEDRNYLIVVDASSNIESCKRITNYKGIEEINIKK